MKKLGFDIKEAKEKETLEYKGARVAAEAAILAEEATRAASLH